MRDLRILSRLADARVPEGADARVSAGDAEALLQRALVDRPAAPPWQREPVALARGGPLEALVVGDPLVPRAFALYAAGERGVVIADLTARDPAGARPLLDAVARARLGRALSMFNVPTDDPAAPAFDAAGFRETLRQHEMWAGLA